VNRQTICRACRSRIAKLALSASSFACLLLVLDPASAQHAKPAIERQIVAGVSDLPEIPRNDANLRVNSDLVLVPATVVDRRDHLVAGLKREDFRLYEDKVEQEITHFVFEDVPVSVGFVFDASGSMAGKLPRSREAVAKFLNTANPDDEFFLVTFNDRVELLMGMTSETEELQNRLMWIQPKGATALLDAVYFSLQQMKKAHSPRKALIIISDGGDNRSRYTIGNLKSLLREAEVQIYAMGIFEPIVRPRAPEEVEGPNVLREITEQSGGRSFEITHLNELSDVASKIGETLRNQYVLGFAPVNPRHDGKYHRLEVKLTSTKGLPKLHAYWRRGYYAPPE
jgi:Ca-activated chloride channel family protein